MTDLQSSTLHNIVPHYSTVENNAATTVLYRTTALHTQQCSQRYLRIDISCHASRNNFRAVEDIEYRQPPRGCGVCASISEVITPPLDPGSTQSLTSSCITRTANEPKEVELKGRVECFTKSMLVFGVGALSFFAEKLRSPWGWGGGGGDIRRTPAHMLHPYIPFGDVRNVFFQCYSKSKFASVTTISAQQPRRCCGCLNNSIMRYGSQ